MSSKPAVEQIFEIFECHNFFKYYFIIPTKKIITNLQEIYTLHLKVWFFNSFLKGFRNLQKEFVEKTRRLIFFYS